MSHDVPWPLESIWQDLVPWVPGLTLELLPRIDSTNAELMRRAQAGHCAPCLLIAEQQTAGRGRHGRIWHGGDDGAPPGLTFSLGITLAPRDWSGLSLAIGLSLAQSLHPDILLKWPNDLWWRDRKLAGILIETVGAGGATAARHVVLGVGLNIGVPAAADWSVPGAGLTELLPDSHAAWAMRQLGVPLVQTLLAFEQHGFAPLQADFNARDALAGRAVLLSDGTQGVAQGVDASGALCLHTAQGVQWVRSAEVSVRPWVPSASTLGPE